MHIFCVFVRKETLKGEFLEGGRWNLGWRKVEGGGRKEISWDVGRLMWEGGRRTVVMEEGGRRREKGEMMKGWKVGNNYLLGVVCIMFGMEARRAGEMIGRR